VRGGRWGEAPIGGLNSDIQGGFLDAISQSYEGKSGLKGRRDKKGGQRASPAFSCGGRVGLRLRWKKGLCH